MKKNILLCIVFMLLILTSCEKLEMTNEVIDTTAQLQLAPPVYDHIFVVWFENFDRDDIWGSSSCPYMNSLIRSGTLFKSFYCYTNSASQPNYVVAFAGSRCGINTNSTLSGRPLTNPNLHTALVAKGKTFKTYCEGIPYAGSTTSSSGYYRRRHNAPINFSNVPGSLIKPFPLPSNYDSYATVTWIVPNLRNDGHDTGKGYADNWMKNTLKPMVEYCNVPSNNSLFILYFDEGSGSDRKIAATFVGNRVRANNVVSTTYDVGHLYLLRTILDMYGCGHLGSTPSYGPLTGWYN